MRYFPVWPPKYWPPPERIHGFGCSMAASNFSAGLGDADGSLDLTFGNASLFRHLRLRQRKEGALLFHMIATPIELLQQLAHAANRARLNSVGEPAGYVGG
jgi:hypothetical protein